MRIDMLIALGFLAFAIYGDLLSIFIPKSLPQPQQPRPQSWRHILSNGTYIQPFGRYVYDGLGLSIWMAQS